MNKAILDNLSLDELIRYVETTDNELAKKLVVLINDAREEEISATNLIEAKMVRLEIRNNELDSTICSMYDRIEKLKAMLRNGQMKNIHRKNPFKLPHEHNPDDFAFYESVVLGVIALAMIVGGFIS